MNGLANGMCAGASKYKEQQQEGLLHAQGHCQGLHAFVLPDLNPGTEQQYHQCCTLQELQQETRAGRDYETSQTVHNMHNQLQALQRSFMTLSDALLDELGEQKPAALACQRHL